MLRGPPRAVPRRNQSKQMQVGIERKNKMSVNLKEVMDKGTD